MYPFKLFSKCFYQALADTVDHDGIEHAGYLAFVMVLSVFPFLVFFFAIAGFIGNLEVGNQFVELMYEYIPRDLIAGIEPRIHEIETGPPQGLLTLAIVGAIWTASSTVEGLRTILNRAFRVTTPPAYIWRRLLSIAQFLILTVIILVAMFMLIFAPIMWVKIQEMFGLSDLLNPVWSYIRVGLSGAVLLFAIATIYYILPNIKQRWKAVMPGAFLTMVGWLGVSMLFSMYLRNFDQVNLIYGSLGGIIISLLYFYVVNMILIFGAEFNAHLEEALGHKVQVKE